MQTVYLIQLLYGEPCLGDEGNRQGNGTEYLIDRDMKYRLGPSFIW